jgi:hypothetical protein
MAGKGWVAVDLDGTLAEYHGWHGETHIGAPIPAMVERVKRWLAEGHEVRILTARMCSLNDVIAVGRAIGDWTQEHLGRRLTATCIKDEGMIELWDDRAVTVEKNTGRQLAPSTRGLDG